MAGKKKNLGIRVTWDDWESLKIEAARRHKSVQRMHEEAMRLYLGYQSEVPLTDVNAGDTISASLDLTLEEVKAVKEFVGILRSGNDAANRIINESLPALAELVDATRTHSVSQEQARTNRGGSLEPILREGERIEKTPVHPKISAARLGRRKRRTGSDVG